MDQTQFDGQQQGERILHVIHEHPFTTKLSFATSIAAAVIIIALTLLIASGFPQASGIIRTAGFVLGIGVGVLGTLWIRIREQKTVTYITDRRIMRFEAETPIFTAKRALFWTDALKAKAVTQNMFWKLFNIGDIIVETHVADQGEIRVSRVHYYEDLANYIDKILYTVKHAPQELQSIRGFVAMPKGKRDHSG